MHVLPVTQSTVSLKEQLEILTASTQIDGQVKNLMHKNADANQGKKSNPCTTALSTTRLLSEGPFSHYANSKEDQPAD